MNIFMIKVDILKNKLNLAPYIYSFNAYGNFSIFMGYKFKNELTTDMINEKALSIKLYD